MNHNSSWYLLVNGKTSGPFPIEKVRQQAARGMFRPGVQASADGFVWKPVEIMLAELGGAASAVPMSSAQFPNRVQQLPISNAGDLSLPPPCPPVGRSDLFLPMWIMGGVCLLLVFCVVLIVVIRTDVHLAKRNAEPAEWVGADFPEAVEDAFGGDLNQGADVPRLEPFKPAVPAPKVFNAKALVERFAPSVGRVEFQQSRGSGFLVDRDLLATNAHVVGNRDDVNVRVFFPSAVPGERGPHNGRVVFMNAQRDIALVRVKTDLDFLKLGDSDGLKKGEDIVVIGSPGLGNGLLENTVSKGIFGTTVKQPGEGVYLHMSLAVNPGNSGGPAFNDRGEVIGIVTAKGLKVEGVALCVPINDLKNAIENAR